MRPLERRGSGLYHDGWMASAISFPPWQPLREKFDPDQQKWELYNIDEDFSQANDLAAKRPEMLRQLQDLWWAETRKVQRAAPGLARCRAV